MDDRKPILQATGEAKPKTKPAASLVLERMADKKSENRTLDSARGAR